MPSQRNVVVTSRLTLNARINSIANPQFNVCLTGWLQPVLNKERLRIASPVFKLLLCRCDGTGDASRLGNNEISLMKQIGLNSATKNRTLIYPYQPNLIIQRTAAAAGVVHGFTWNKEEQGAGADV